MLIVNMDLENEVPGRERKQPRKAILLCIEKKTLGHSGEPEPHGRKLEEGGEIKGQQVLLGAGLLENAYCLTVSCFLEVITSTPNFKNICYKHSQVLLVLCGGKLGSL